MKTSIVIITFNNIEYTKQCIESIRSYTEVGTYEIIVVDNNSTDGTIDWLKSNKDISCIFNKENVGFPIACNQGIKLSNNNDILLLNNDVIVTPNWLLNLNKCLYSNSSIGAVGPITNNCSYLQAISVSYKSKDEMIVFAKKNNISDSLKWEERLKLIGFCMLIKREVIDKIGLLDEEFSPGNYEDDDYCLRIRNEGYRLILCRDSFIHHYGSASFSKDTESFNNLLQRNLLKFESKWKGSWWDLFGFRLDIPGYIEKKEDESFSFLHIGCKGCGTLLNVKSKFRNSRLYGIEQNKSLLVGIDHFANIKGIGAGESNFDKNLFDYIFIEESCIDKILNNIRITKESYKKDSVIILSTTKVDSDKEDKLKKGLTEQFRDFYIEKFERDSIVDFIIHLNPCCNEIEIINMDEKDNIENVKIIDENKMDFICCIRDKYKFNIIFESIKKLNIPSQFRVRVIATETQKSYTSAYNAGMQGSNAKYKVYLHDDVSIMNKNFIYDVLNIFKRHGNIGLIGVIGAKEISRNGIWWESNEIYGKVYDSHSGFMQLLEFNSIQNDFEIVECIDGLIMVTQYDLPWKDELFNGWHFYDIAQCFEFRKNGYEIVVPKQNLAWCKHNCGIFNEHEQFENYRKTFVHEYLDTKKEDIEEESNEKGYFLSLYPEAENHHLTKDIGMIPFIMYKYFGYNTKVACYRNGKYENLGTQVEGLNIDFIERITENPEIDTYAYLVENSKNIRVLLLHELEPRIFKWIDIYTTMNPKGQVFLRLNKKNYSKEEDIKANLNIDQKELLEKCKTILIEPEDFDVNDSSEIERRDNKVFDFYWIDACNKIMERNCSN